LKIPDKVKVAGIEYKVEICKDYTDEMNEAEFRGKVFFKENKIKLLNSYSIDEKMRTLIHEVLHIIDDNSKIDMSEEANYGSRDGHGKGRGMPGGGRRNQNPNPCGRGGRGIGRGTNRK